MAVNVYEGKNIRNIGIVGHGGSGKTSLISAILYDTGATNRLGEHASERPVHFQEIFATLYKNLGIDVSRARLTDTAGRPQFLTEMQPISELI